MHFGTSSRYLYFAAGAKVHRVSIEFFPFPLCVYACVLTLFLLYSPNLRHTTSHHTTSCNLLLYSSLVPVLLSPI